MARKNRFGIILIHGIGDIKSSNVISRVSEAIRKKFPELLMTGVIPLDDITSQRDKEKISINKANLLFKETDIQLYEFYWKDPSTRIKWWDLLAVLRGIFDIFRDAPLLRINSTGKFGKFISKALSLYMPASMTILAVMPIFQVAKAFYGFSPHLIWYTQIASIVMFVDFILWLPMYVADLFFRFSKSREKAGVRSQIKSLTVNQIILMLHMLMCALFSVSLFLLDGISPQMLTTFFTKKSMYSLIKVLSTNGVQISIALAIYGFFVFVVSIIKDITHYLSPDSKGNPKPHQKTIRVCLWKLIDRINHNGIRDITLVTHSLGSVVAIDTLLEKRSRSKNGNIRFSIVTAGSPLRRFIGRLVSSHDNNISSILEQFEKSKQYTVARWVNIFRILDYVGQALTFSFPGPKMFKKESEFHLPKQGILINEVLITPRYQRPFLHSDYWGDQRFIDTVATKCIFSDIDAKEQELPWNFPGAENFPEAGSTRPVAQMAP